MTEARNFYLVYAHYKDDIAYERRRTFTKSDMYWFGTDERMALQHYRQLARGTDDKREAHIKCIDLNELPEYQTKSPADTMIGALNEKVAGPINRIFGYNYIKTRGCTTDKGVTFSLMTDKIDPIAPDWRGRLNKSLVHKDSIDAYYVVRDAFNDVFEILVDHYLKDVEVLTPTKININGKTHRKLEPTKGV